MIIGFGPEITHGWSGYPVDPVNPNDKYADNVGRNYGPLTDEQIQELRAIVDGIRAGLARISPFSRSDKAS